MAKMKKKVLMIPTPGQDEQIYLAEHLSKSFGITIQMQNNIVLSDEIRYNLKCIDII